MHGKTTIKIIWGLFERLFDVPINEFAFLMLVLEGLFDLNRISLITACRSVQWLRKYMFLVMKTKLMHYLPSVYFVSQPLHVSGIFVAHHQEVYCIYTTYIYDVSGQPICPVFKGQA
jgi:hypothetical protein